MYVYKTCSACDGQLTRGISNELESEREREREGEREKILLYTVICNSCEVYLQSALYHLIPYIYNKNSLGHLDIRSLLIHCTL